MAVLFTSQFKALAHGALNWDTQLDSDLGLLETLFASQVVTQRTDGNSEYVGTLNNATAPGVYRINAASQGNANMPNNAYQYGCLLVFKAGQSIVQIYVADGAVPYLRTTFDGNFSVWRQINATQV